MYFQKILALVTVAGIFLSFGECLSVEDLLTHELDRFISVRNVLKSSNLDVSVIFSQSTVDEDGDLTAYDSVEFRTVADSLPDDTSEEMDDEVTEEYIEKVIKFAQHLNASVVVSSEEYKPDGSLLRKDLYAEDLKVHLSNGVSVIKMKDSFEEMEDNSKLLDEFLSGLKDFEFKIQASGVEYNDEGIMIGASAEFFIPEKVKIISATKMPLAMQLTAAEALKRSFSIKHTPEDRMTLVCKFLGIQYSDYAFGAVSGGGNHHIDSKFSIVLSMKDETYTIWGQTAVEEE